MKYVKTDYDGCPYFTAGKVYELNDSGYHPKIVTDEGKETVLLLMEYMAQGIECPHLDDIGTWTECDAEGNETGGGDE